ncbi:hypothetical protein [Pseudomonas sp. Teo4]|uniref:hypothetical protein n=1 Tax=Pseudomonas sp. Teo4 TaxID=3064528 RepID=UPI002ABB9BC6|nr:hypothetical protein [Pseudomonas sp. Teo4]MDZ3993949.1 hypothetical protein [Pseudomonas sp. Teo4]
MSDLNPESTCGTIVESTIMPFGSNVSLDEREDILLVIRYAHLVATSESEAPLFLDWFPNFRRKLSFLGWDATPPPIVKLPGPSREQLVEKVLRGIGQVGSQEHVAETERSLWALQHDSALRLRLETRMRETDTKHIQFMPCVRRSGSYFDMVLFHLEATQLDDYLNVLFASHGEGLGLRAQSAELIRFNLRLFRDHHHQKVEKFVTSQDRQFIAKLIRYGSK